MRDLDEVHDLRFRGAIDAAHLRSLPFLSEKDAEFEEIPFWAHEEIAGPAREHDRLVGGIDALFAKGDGSLAQTFPGVAQIVGEILGEGGFRCRPAVVGLAVLDPLFAVVTLPASHVSL